MDALTEKTITLPVSGKVVVITAKALTGRDLINARRYCATDGDIAMGFALYAAVCVFKVPNQPDRQLVYEDVLDMDTRDLNALQEALKGDPRFPTPATGAAAPMSASSSPASSPSGSA